VQARSIATPASAHVRMSVARQGCADLGSLKHVKHPAVDSPEPADSLAVKHVNGVSYVSGGADREEVIAMRAMAGPYNLCLAFVGKHGARLAGVNARIFRSNGALVFNAYAQGPLMLVRLPPGRYRVIAIYNGIQRSTAVEAREKGSTARTLTWSEPARLVV